MIDIENEVFNYVANALRAEFPGISVYGEEVETPSSFPSVSLVEESNTEIAENKTLARKPETACSLMYRAQVYSNLQVGKKAQTKAIIKIVNEAMHKFGFNRDFCNQLANIDRTIYRIVAQYTKTFQTF